MRLDNQTRDIVKNEVSQLLGNDAVVRLFGSRVDDAQRGGDIDLLIDVATPLTGRVKVECRLAARLFIKLGGRKVDVLIREPNKPMTPIYEQALRQGVII
jgi:predicted nucleotidyltransferase